MVSLGGVQNFMSSVGITLKPKLLTGTDAAGRTTMFAGVDVPVMGKVGLNIGGGGIKFGRFQDPRAALRNAVQNRVNVDPNSGSSSRRPVPSSTGGKITSKGMTYDDITGKLRGTGQLFEDPDFIADGSSLFYSSPAPRGLEWKRPGEICNDPQFVSGGTSRFDVRQGELGDCWLLAAVANLSLYQSLLNQVVPPDQGFDPSTYCGVFRFHFWRFGEWVEVVVDDRLPTRNGQLIFMHSTDRNEFWSALLEKAYAKLFGSYEALRGGSTIEALEDFTGGLAEFYDLRGKQPADLSKIMTKGYARRTLMACSIGADPNVVEAEQPNGLIRGHAYSITKVATINAGGGPVQLIRIRNPWGNEAEWKGRWSDKSNEWQSVSADERQKLGLTFDADGEFWMCYDDFVTEYEKLEMCALGPQSLDEEDGGNSNIAFQMTLEHGSWQPGVSAGGCRNFLDTFWTNPQYRVHVEDADDEDDENKGTLIIGLMQKDRRKMRKQGAEMLTIGFMVYALKEQHKGTLDLNFFKYNAAVARSPAFINTREVTGRFRLEPGDYVIVPSTFNKNERADFLLRIFSEKLNTSEQMDDNVGMEDPSAANIPEPINANQVQALRNAFEKVCGSDGEITADELIDILNVAFTKELNEARDDETGGQAVVQNNVKKSAPSAGLGAGGKGLSFLCCGFGQTGEATGDAAGGTRPGSKGADGTDFTFQGFSIEACRSLIAMMDVDRSGSLDFDEFKTLWETLRLWKGIFKKYDADNSGTMSTFELRNALNSAGFHIDNATFTSLVLRFSNRDRILRFDDYIICCARLRTAFETIGSGDTFGGAQLLNILLYL